MPSLGETPSELLAREAVGNALRKLESSLAILPHSLKPPSASSAASGGAAPSGGNGNGNGDKKPDDYTAGANAHSKSPPGARVLQARVEMMWHGTIAPSATRSNGSTCRDRVGRTSVRAHSFGSRRSGPSARRGGAGWMCWSASATHATPRCSRSVERTLWRIRVESLHHGEVSVGRLNH